MLVVTLALVVAPGCAKKIPAGPVGEFLVDYPEGRRDTLERTPSDLVVWSDMAMTVRERSTDPSTAPRTFIVYRSAPGVMHGMIADYVQSSAYQMFREEAGGGYRRFSDFDVTPSRRWSDRTYYGGSAGAIVLPPSQFFTFSDPMPAAIPLKGYVGRAVIAGVSGSLHPLTNHGAAPDTTAIAPIRYTGLTGIPGAETETGPSPPDSLLDMSWDPVPGAAGYWVHIYQKRADIRTSDEAIGIAQPSPIAIGKVRDLFIGYFPAPRTSYKLGDPVPIGSRVLVYRILNGLQEVLIRISAVNASGRMIAMTGSADVLTITNPADRDSASERFDQIDRVRAWPLNAKRVTPGRP